MPCKRSTNRISQTPHTRSTSTLASPRQVNLIRGELNASIGDAAASEWSILDEVPLQTTLSDSGSDSDSEWSNLGGVPL
jgi:hypothetical protein